MGLSHSPCDLPPASGPTFFATATVWLYIHGPDPDNMHDMSLVLMNCQEGPKPTSALPAREICVGDMGCVYVL